LTGAVVCCVRGNKIYFLYQGTKTYQIMLGYFLLLGLVTGGQCGSKILSQDFIEYINQQNSTWTAGQNFHPDTSHSFIRSLMGVHPAAHKFMPKEKKNPAGS